MDKKRKGKERNFYLQVTLKAEATSKDNLGPPFNVLLRGTGDTLSPRWQVRVYTLGFEPTLLPG